jgi:hypothetical protein
LGRVRFWFAAFLILGAYFYLAVWPLFRAKPRTQPIRFSHAVHIKEAKCEACHLHATDYYPAGVPTLTECEDCHEGMQSKTPQAKKEEEKLQKFVAAKREIPWELLPPLPTYVFFSHRRHTVAAKIECATCHGDIAKTSEIPGRPAHDFTMKWCLHCHRARRASTDCVDCHR